MALQLEGIKFIAGTIGNQKFQFHRRLSLEAVHLAQADQGGHCVEEPAHAAGVGSVDPPAQHLQNNLPLRRTEGFIIGRFRQNLAAHFK